MAWIESHQTLERHTKTLILRRHVGWNLNETIGFLHRFWWWALDAAPDGDVTEICRPGVCGDAFGLASDTGDKAVEGMIKARWLDKRDDGRIVIHNHEKYRGRLTEKREQDRERQEKRRNRLKNMDVAERHADVTPVSRSCHADVADVSEKVTPTVHNITVQETLSLPACARDGEKGEESRDEPPPGKPPDIPDEVFSYAVNILGWHTPDVPLGSLLMDYRPEWVLEAMKTLADKPGSKRTPSYLRGILKKFARNGGTDDEHADTGRNPAKRHREADGTRKPGKFAELDRLAAERRSKLAAELEAKPG